MHTLAFINTLPGIPALCQVNDHDKHSFVFDLVYCSVLFPQTGGAIFFTRTLCSAAADRLVGWRLLHYGNGQLNAPEW